MPLPTASAEEQALASVAGYDYPHGVRRVVMARGLTVRVATIRVAAVRVIAATLRSSTAFAAAQVLVLVAWVGVSAPTL